MLHSNQHLQLIELLLQAPLQTVQVTKGFQVSLFSKIHDGKDHDAVLKYARSVLPQSLQRELPLCGSYPAIPSQEFLLQSDKFRFLNESAVVVFERQVDLN